MRIGRTLPPAAAPIYLRDILSGIKALFKGSQEIDRFQSELKDYFGVKHCFLVSSGKAALSIILQALRDIQPKRDEVLIPAFTCYSVPSAIVRSGLKVKLCDMNPDTLDFDFDQLRTILSQYSAAQLPNKRNKPEKPDKPNKPDSPNQPNEPAKPTGRLLCIIPTHLFGIPSDIGRIRKLLADPDVTIVEDAAQALGTESNGKKLGTFGEISFFSLGRGKAFSTVEGGIIVTDRDDIAEKIRARMRSIPDYGPVEAVGLFLKAILLSLFLHPSLFWLPKSIPFLKLGETIYDPHFQRRKMSAFQVGLAKLWRKKLREFKKLRRKNSNYWSKIMQATHLKDYISSILSANPTNPMNPSNSTNPDLIRFPVRVDDSDLRTAILRRSNRMGLGIMPTYPDSIDGIPELWDGFQSQNFPEAKKHAENLITFPTHSFVTQKDRQEIAELILQLTPISHELSAITMSNKL